VILANRRQPDRRCGQVARDSSLRGLQRDRVPIARRREKRIFGFVTVGSGLALGIPLSQFERGASGIYAIGGCCAILTFLGLEANRSKRCSIGTVRSCFLNWRRATRASHARTQRTWRLHAHRRGAIVALKLSTTTLSQQSPLRLMLHVMP
jgi:hypothetical protein